MLRLLAIVCLMAAQGAEPDAAVVIDSGSTNRAGFRIAVERSGEAEMTATPRRRSGPQDQTQPMRRMLPRASAERFYSDLKAAKSLASLPAIHCMKSVSFGSTLSIAFDGEQTPDLSCGDGGNTAMRNLIRDAHEIVELFQDN